MRLGRVWCLRCFNSRWNRSVINVATGKLIFFFLVFNKFFWGVEILGWFSTDEWRLDMLMRMYRTTNAKIKLTSY